MDHETVLAFAALAHPKRLQILRLLMRHYPHAVPAGAIALGLSIKPSTLSGYLAQMTEAGLIAQDRRGTSLHYRAALDRIEGLNAAWIGDVCLGRGLPPVPARGPRVYNLLFLGRGNAGPSLFAEALMRDRAGDRYEVFSAGVARAAEGPSEVPDALMGLLQEQGLAADLLWAKPVTEFLTPEAPRLDVVITLGATAQRQLPVFGGLPVISVWSLPPRMSGADLTALLEARIGSFSQLDPRTAARGDMQAVLDGVTSCHPVDRAVTP